MARNLKEEETDICKRQHQNLANSNNTNHE